MINAFLGRGTESDPWGEPVLPPVVSEGGEDVESDENEWSSSEWKSGQSTCTQSVP